MTMTDRAVARRGGPGGPWLLGLRPKPRGGFASRMLLGAIPPEDNRWGRPPPDILLNSVWDGAPMGSGAEPQRGSEGGALSYIRAAPRGLGRSPNSLRTGT